MIDILTLAEQGKTSMLVLGFFLGVWWLFMLRGVLRSPQTRRRRRWSRRP